MKTLNLIETAQFLGIHKETARNLAASHRLPGAKVGRSWRFLEIDLVAYLRSLYSGEASQGVTHRNKTIWHSTNVTTFGGLISSTKAEEYEKLLGLR